MEDGSGGGRRSLRYEFGRESNASTAGLTLGGILSIKETPSYRIQNRTLLDLIRDDPTCGNDSKKAWKMFREKLRLKLVGSACTTTVRILASHVHVTTESNRTTPRNDTNNRLNLPPVINTGSVPDTQSANGTNRSNSPPVSNTGSVPDTQSANGTNLSYSPPVSNIVSVADTQTANRTSSSPPRTNTSSVPVSQTVILRSEPLAEELEATTTEENRRDGGDGGPATVKMSLMSLLEVDGSAYFDDDDGEGKAEEEVAEEAGVGGGEYRYNNCCVCMIRHKGAAFIPCGHTFCRVCSRELFVKRANCPLCNNFIVEILDIF